MSKLSLNVLRLFFKYQIQLAHLLLLIRLMHIRLRHILLRHIWLRHIGLILSRSMLIRNEKLSLRPLGSRIWFFINYRTIRINLVLFTARNLLWVFVCRIQVSCRNKTRLTISILSVFIWKHNWLDLLEFLLLVWNLALIASFCTLSFVFSLFESVCLWQFAFIFVKCHFFIFFSKLTHLCYAQ